MLISKFPAAFAVKFLLVPCAFAQIQTRLPEVGVSSPRAGAQGNTPIPRLSPPPEQKRLRPCARRRRGGWEYRNKCCAREARCRWTTRPPTRPAPFDISPLPPLRAALFANS